MLELKQTCNGCGATREVGLDPHDNAGDIRKRAETRGWREIDPGVHLCKKCIDGALSQKTHAP